MTTPTLRLAGASLIVLLASMAQAETVQTRIGDLSFDVG